MRPCTGNTDKGLDAGIVVLVGTILDFLVLVMDAMNVGVGVGVD